MSEPTTPPVCRHCRRRKKANGKRGLCCRCYYTLEIRVQYPSESKYAQHGCEVPDDELPIVHGGLSQREVAAFLGVTKQAVAAMEWHALQKLRRHPIIRRLAVECGVLPEE